MDIWATGTAAKRQPWDNYGYFDDLDDTKEVFLLLRNDAVALTSPYYSYTVADTFESSPSLLNPLGSTTTVPASGSTSSSGGGAGDWYSIDDWV